MRFANEKKRQNSTVSAPIEQSTVKMANNIIIHKLLSKPFNLTGSKL
jgi:hypothetical protein